MCTVNILKDAEQENTGLGLPLCVNEHNILPGIASATSQKKTSSHIKSGRETRMLHQNMSSLI